MAAKKRLCTPSGPKHMQQGIVYSFCEVCGRAVGLGQLKACGKRRKPQPRRQRQIVLYDVRN